IVILLCVTFFFSSRRRHTRFSRDWSSDVCSSDLTAMRSSSETMQRASTSTTYTAPALGCSSDFECRWGNVCVKPPSRMQGVCARAVDAHGIPTFQAPRGSSFRARRTRVHIFQPVPDRLFVHRRTLFEVRTIGARLSPYSLFV